MCQPAPMLDVLVDLVDRATGRCAYAEARHVSTDDEYLLEVYRQASENAGGPSLYTRLR